MLDGDSNEIFSSLKHLEKFRFDGIQPPDWFQLHRLSELIYLKEIYLLQISENDLDQFRETFRSRRRRTGGEVVEQQPNPNPTSDDLCAVILRDMKRLEHLHLSHCGLTNISKAMFSQMKYLSVLALQANNIRHIPDDTFDCLVNLKEINLKGNQLQQIKLNRLFLKCDKLKQVYFNYETPIVDLMDENFNFKSIVTIKRFDYDRDHLEKFYHSRRAFLQQNQRKVSEDLPDLESEMESIEIMFQNIDIKFRFRFSLFN